MVLDEAEILQFWIKKELQHQGYGKIFLEYIIDLCKKLQISDIFLEVRSDNICAFRLYSKFGFNHAGIRKDYYKIEGWVFDAITMHKKLAISNATTII
jgi:ribosomal-protein-alanine acetyltransferase